MPFLYLSPGYLIGMAVWLAAMGAFLVALLRYRRTHRGKGGRTRLANAGLSLWMVLAAVTSLELVFALFVDFSDTFNISNVSKRWLLMHIDAERNNVGARDARDFVTYLPKGQKRIVFVGDSFTAGHGVKRIEDRFTDRLAAELEAAAPGKYVVANRGEPGYEASMIEALVRGMFEILNADVQMVVYVYNLNDIEGYDVAATGAVQTIQAAAPTNFLLRDTYFLNWLYFRYLQYRGARETPYFERLKAAYNGDAWDGVPGRPHLRNKLVEIKRDCESRGVDFRMVIFPFLHDLGDDYPFRDVHARLVAFCREQEIPVLDLEPVFRRHAGENLMVSRFDAHPNERAHAIAAEAIKTELLPDLFGGKK